MPELRGNFLASKELMEITLVEEVLRSWGGLDSKEELSFYLVQYTHHLSSQMILKPPS